ncbi:MAG: hypothetical protein K0S68_554 [Candidatus Saccharibacteria bacterium]|jgi:hypothetical protein|nr:hypothetical protein [Candidatus Saccharibacteria bacterium]
MAKSRYSKNLNVLVPLVTYFALTNNWLSRTPDKIADELLLPRGDVSRVLEAFDGIFWEKPDGEGKYFYTLHARYAIRPSDQRLDEAPKDPFEIRMAIHEALLAFVTQRAHAERTEVHARVAAVAVVIAAVITAVAAIVLGVRSS